MKITHKLTMAIALLAVAAGTAAADWPMWGGTPERNMVSGETNLALTWDEEGEGPAIRWVAKLGSQTYGNPVIADGRVYVGTNNGNPRQADVKGDKGIMMCFSTDGKFLWQAVHDKLETGDKEDWAEIGICSTPSIVGDRLYYVSNRCEIIACDVDGFMDDENDGPFTGETMKGKDAADFVWKVDMRKEFGVAPFQASASSPVVAGDLVFVVTGHGVDEKTYKVLDPKVPSFVAVNRHTGEVVWKDSSPGENLVEGQWGSPAYGVVDGVEQVAFPGGDGWLYSFEPKTGKLLWKFDCNVHEKEGEESSNQLLCTPVFHGKQVLLAVGQNPEAGGAPGCLRAIDATKRGDISKTAEVWRVEGDDFGVSIATVAIHDGLVYATQLDGLIDCFELSSGKRVWQHDLLAYVWGSPYVADGKVYVRNGDGDVVILAAGKKKKVLATNTLPGLYHGTVVASDGVLYVAGESQLYAIAPAADDKKTEK